MPTPDVFDADPVYRALAARAARGDPLTRAEDLVPETGLSPATVRRRILRLADHGAVIIRPGRANTVRRIIEVPGIGATAAPSTPLTRFLDWLGDHPGAAVPQIEVGLGVDRDDALRLVRAAWMRDRIERLPRPGPARYIVAGTTPPEPANDALDLPAATGWAETWRRVATLARQHRTRFGAETMHLTMMTSAGIRVTTATDRAGAPVYCVELEVDGQWEVYSDHATPTAALLAATALVMDETPTAA